jgi:triosephosphate isomerase
MTGTIRPLVAGNWKMNGRLASVTDIDRLKEKAALSTPACDIMVCPPAPYLLPVGEAMENSSLLLGGQDCDDRDDGAHTGDVSARMLADVGCAGVIVGHCERRSYHGETDAAVARKALAARAAGLVSIICVGETQEERDEGRTNAVLERQLAGSVPEGATAKNTVIAYEPVWAIGTGRTPTPEDVADTHLFIRRHLEGRFGGEGTGMRILYGGSVKPGNAAELMAVANVNGALVGGASLEHGAFWGIVAVYLKA